MHFLLTLGEATEALTRNLLRSALTSLGIIIGVAAVIVMMALGDGARQSIATRVASLGTNVITVSAGSFMAGGVRLGQGATTTLTPEDAVALAAEVPGIADVSPGVSSRAQVVSASGNWQTQVQGVSEALPHIRDWTVVLGTFFEAADVARASKVVVLGSAVRDQLFGTGADPVGQIVRINNQPFKVIGVLGRKGQSPMGQDQDDAVFAPYTTVQKRILGITHVTSISLLAAGGISTLDLTPRIEAVLRQRHGITGGSASDFTVRTPEEMAAVLNETTATMTYLLAGVAAVSLLVGGIGIMNIMLVSVTERTKEIGLRRALGARRHDVLGQFVAEAVMLSLAGGLAGVALGIASAWGMTTVFRWATAVSTPAVALSFGFAAAVGVLFGYFPARRAAGLNPTEALHYE
ncbi:MAG: ABC transporter permease [Vicinamibacterales bacterium]